MRSTHPPPTDAAPPVLAPLIIHPLPAAPTFTGRERELEELKKFWQEPHGVLSLVGLGGAGKTALAQRFLAWLQANDPPDGLLVWSFYEEPDANSFLQAAYEYFTGGRTAEAQGAGWFHLLKEALNTGGRYLLVLDGLERVQRTQTDVAGIYGEMEDPLLRGLLTRLAAGSGATKAIITSRFPVSDVEKWLGRGYTLLDVDHLTDPAARALMRAHGVVGTDKALDTIIQTYGGHALTLDLLGGAIARFFEGKPELAPDLPSFNEEADPQSHRLARVLEVYEENLPPAEVALLSRLCIFRFGVDAPALDAIFLGPGKEAIAGDMAGMSRKELEAALDELVHRHLTIREGRGRFTIHPAVRDHFYRLFREPAAMHAAVREHFTSLTNRPGIGLPDDKATLDLLEELIYHAIKAGGVAEAIEIYRHRLGGNDHLNAKLGEYVRTHRILRAFEAHGECPDRSAMYHCLRAFGKFDEALKWRPQNRYIRILNGELTPLLTDASETTSRFARFLQGESVAIPERSPDMPVPAAMLHLYRDATEDARRLAENEKELSLYQDDLARGELMLAEVERRSGQPERCRERMEAASPWILHSGSQEHLGLLHLVRARLAIDEKAYPSAHAALEEGLHTARESDFGLLLIDFTIEQTRLHLLETDATWAEASAQEALRLARAPNTRFVWGEAEAGHLLGEALATQKRLPEAQEVLQHTLALRKRINDPASLWTDRALRQVEMQMAAS